MQYKTIDEANQAVIQHITASEPFLLDVVPAKSVISELNGKALYTQDLQQFGKKCLINARFLYRCSII